MPFRPTQVRNHRGPKFVPDKSFPRLVFGQRPNQRGKTSITKILLTVGHVVLFTLSRLTGDGRFAHTDGRQPLAAIAWPGGRAAYPGPWGNEERAVEAFLSQPTRNVRLLLGNRGHAAAFARQFEYAGKSGNFSNLTELSVRRHVWRSG